ncbi:MAG: glycosyltransferase family 39 protein [Lentimicrobiaceae bacterium]|jgi:hypothetical protein|nr:glycosyltransferase family 39 protein [Lentimicrobiaceae bacterium]
MSFSIQNNRKILVYLLVTSALIRLILAYWVELGNDEVYYWTYALHPSWSYFDHPPMLAWVIRIFSFNLLFDNELLLRLSSVIFMTINTYLVYRIGKQIRDIQTGLYTAFLYTASIYAFVITGIFIMPDTPLSLFWFLALFMLIKAIQTQQSKSIIWAGFFIGLAILSKYTGVFLWIGMGLYCILFDRQWFKKPTFYMAVGISLLCLFPIIYWNLNNNFISFNFHSARLEIENFKLHFDLFGTELLGEFAYNNPFNVVLIVIALIAIVKKNRFLTKNAQRLLLCVSLPLILTFLVVSLFRFTLPHWTAPAFCTLIFVAASYLASKNPIQEGKIKIPIFICAALITLIITLIIGVVQIKTGFIPLDGKQEYHLLGKNDFSLDMYGWRAVKPEFEKIRNKKIAQGLMKPTDGFIGENWFPLAHNDYYIAHPLGIKTFGMGKVEKIHQYLWTNELRGNIQKGESYWFITNSRNYEDPSKLFENNFSKIIRSDTIEIMRCGKPAKRYFIFLLKDLKTEPYSLSDFVSEKQTQKL